VNLPVKQSACTGWRKHNVSATIKQATKHIPVKTVTVILLLLAAGLFARGQTNLTPEQRAARVLEMQQKLNAAISNNAARPRPLVTPAPKAPEPLNPVAEGLKFAAERNLTADTNYTVVVTPDGHVHRVLKRMPEPSYISLSRDAKRAFLTNYVTEIITNTPTTNAPGRGKQVPVEIRNDPEKFKRWKHENFPDLYPDPDKKVPSGGGDFDETEWTPGPYAAN